ncbi:putative FCP1 domain, HAD superfamily protein [Helianthus annuus]|nr:putative FCP1 domain, HAD superfamily protein [Helianthus annuus]
MCLYVICVYAVYRRPFCQEFLEFCFQRFQVGIWSSAMEFIYGFWFWYFSVFLPCRYHTSIIVTVFAENSDIRNFRILDFTVRIRIRNFGYIRNF